MENLGSRLIDLVIFFPLFLVAIMAHEVSHGYVALREGDPTAKYMGRLSFNPIVHFDPMGLLFFIFSFMVGFGFGWAKPVPINPLNFKNYRNGIIKVSLAGVGANFVLIVIAVIMMKLLIVAGFLHFEGGNFFGESSHGAQYYTSHLLMLFIYLNAALIAFNLIPVPPLDGSKVLMMLLPRESAMALARMERYGFLILIFLLYIGVFRIIYTLVVGVIMFFAYIFFAL